MKKTFKDKFIITIKVIFIFLFFCVFFVGKGVLAEGFTEGAGPTLKELQSSSYNWQLSYYGGTLNYNEQTGKYSISNLAAHVPNSNRKFNYKDFTRNDTYGWYEYSMDDKKYVVLSGATRNLLEGSTKYGMKDDFHYFKLGLDNNNWAYDIIQFKFASWSSDETIFDAIVIDNSETAMNPKTKNIQVLQAYTFPIQNKDTLNSLNNISASNIDGITDEEKQQLLSEDYDGIKKQAEVYNQKKILVSDDGTFNSLSKGDTIGTFIINFFSKLIIFLADGIQSILISAATETPIDEVSDLTYQRIEIEGSENLQKEIQITEATYDQLLKEDNNGQAKQQTPGKYLVHLPNYILNQAGFEEEMFSMKMDEFEVPVVPIDLHTMTRTKVNIIDIDFFSSSNTNSNKFWKLIKRIVRLASKAVFYVAAMLILTTLIWRGIGLVIASFSKSPERKQKAQRAIDSLLKNMFLIVVVYFIMTIIFYLYRTVSNMIIVDDKDYYIFRFVLDGVISFNTNMIGYIKFLTLTTNGLARLFHAILYLIMALLNALWLVALIVRMLLIAIFIILAPLTAVATVSTEAAGQEKEAKGALYFHNWFIIYTSLVFSPIIVIIGERILTLMLS